MNKSLSLAATLALAALPALAQQSAGHSQDAQSPSASVAQTGGKFVLADGTPVKLLLSETVSSTDAVLGSHIPFEVVEEVSVDGIVVVPKGGTAWATVTDAEPRKRLGGGGKLELFIDKVQLADGSKTLLTVKDGQGGTRTGAMSEAVHFVHGKDITIPKGTAFTAFIQGDDVLDRSKFVKLPQPEATAPVAKSTPPPKPVHQTRVVEVPPYEAPISLGDAAKKNRAEKTQEQQQNDQQQAQQP
jgi:hypothetical protein